MSNSNAKSLASSILPSEISCFTLIKLLEKLFSKLAKIFVACLSSPRANKHSTFRSSNQLVHSFGQLSGGVYSRIFPISSLLAKETNLCNPEGIFLCFLGKIPFLRLLANKPSLLLRFSEPAPSLLTNDFASSENISIGKYARGSTRYLYTNCKYSFGFTNFTKVM